MVKIYNYITKEHWKILHRAILWYWTIIVHFQLYFKILVATCLMMIAYNKAHGLLLRTGYNTLSYYVVGSW